MAPNFGPGLSGTVKAWSGSGNVYIVTTQAAGDINVTQIQIDPTDRIPPGTQVIVVNPGGGNLFFMQVPVWLDPTSGGAFKPGGP